jgi:hypothetical protein
VSKGKARRQQALLTLVISCLLTLFFSPEDGNRLHGVTSQKVALFSHFHENITSHKIHTALEFGNLLKRLIFYALIEMLYIMYGMPCSRVDLFISLQMFWHII